MCLALGDRWFRMSYTLPTVLESWQTGRAWRIEVSCIFKSRLKHRPFSKAVDEQLARWLVASGRTNGRALRVLSRRDGKAIGSKAGG